MGSIPLPQQQISGDPGLESAGPSSTNPAVVNYLKFLASTGGLPADATINKGQQQAAASGGVVPTGTPFNPAGSPGAPITMPTPRSPGAVPLGGNPFGGLQQQQAAQIAAGQQFGRVPIQTMGAGTNPRLLLNPVGQFQPSPYIDTPTESYGSTRAKGIANTVIGASNLIGQIVNKQQQEKQRVLAVDLERVLNAQQGMEQAKNVMDDPNATDQDKQRAAALFQRNQEIINTTMADPKKAKSISKALDINFTNPQENKTPENAALQQAIKTMQQKKGAINELQKLQQSQPQPGQMNELQRLQAPAPPMSQVTAPAQQPQFQPPQATGYAAQLMARTPQVMFDPRSDPKLQEKYIEQQTELMKAQIQEQAQNARFLNEWFLTDKKEQYQSDRMYDMMTHSDAKMMAMIQYGFDKQFQQQQFDRAENDRKIAATAAAKAADPETQLNSLRSLQSATTAEHTRYENEKATWMDLRQKYQAANKINMHFWQDTLDSLKKKADAGDQAALEKYTQMQTFNNQIARAQENIDASANQITELDSLVIEAQRRVLSGKSSSQPGSTTGKPSPSKSAPTTDQIPTPNISVRPSEQSPSSTQTQGNGSTGGAVPVPKQLQQSNF